MKTMPWKWIGASAVFLAILIAAQLIGGILDTMIRYPKRTGLYAVFLTSGQVYFGQIAKENDKALELNSIYYVKPGDAASPADEAANAALIKLGNEFHEPEDAMEINRSQILFIEKLKTDGRVSKAINSYKQKSQ